MKRHQILASGLTAPLICWCSVAAAQPAAAGAVACNFIARGYVNATQGTAVGYFTGVTGISGSLFSGSPSEKTAFLTFRHDVLSLTTPPPANGDFGFFLGSAGRFNIYYNQNPNGDWSNPDTFSGGTFPGNPVAQFTRPETLFFANEFVQKHVFTVTLVSSREFTFNGHKYDFKTIAPGGLTLDETLNPTPDVPGVTDFPVGIAFAGNCLAVGSESKDEQ